jgi:hypothetical protein
VAPGDESNQLELRCQADRIEALVNGSVVWSFPDYTFTSGAFWLPLVKCASRAKTNGGKWWPFDIAEIRIHPDDCLHADLLRFDILGSAGRCRSRLAPTLP